MKNLNLKKVIIHTLKIDTNVSYFLGSSQNLSYLNLNILKISFLFNYVSRNKYCDKLFSFKFKICPEIFFQFSVNC